MTGQGIITAVVFPIVVAVVIWAVTGRRKDQAAIRQLLAGVPKVDAEGKVAAGTVEAAIELADITTLRGSVAAMSEAFREERESMTRRLEEAEEAVHEAKDEIRQMRADQQRGHRELIDMYRRDQYHARALQDLTDWLAENLPKLRRVYPELADPPSLEPLPPLHIADIEDQTTPTRRFYDPGPVTPRARP